MNNLYAFERVSADYVRDKISNASFIADIWSSKNNRDSHAGYVISVPNTLPKSVTDQTPALEYLVLGVPQSPIIHDHISLKAQAAEMLTKFGIKPEMVCASIRSLTYLICFAHALHRRLAGSPLTRPLSIRRRTRACAALGGRAFCMCRISPSRTPCAIVLMRRS